MLAEFTDLVAIGAIPDGTGVFDKYGVRATRLLELASGQVCAYLKYASEADLLADITDQQVIALAAIVAEIAGARINVSAAPSSDPYAVNGAPSSVMLNSWQKRNLDELLGKPGRGSMSLSADRDETTSILTYQIPVYTQVGVNQNEFDWT